MKFSLFHHGGNTPPQTTEERHIEEPIQGTPQAQDVPPKDLEGNAASWATATVVTMANKPADSDVIIAKVDGIYKEFTEFQVNLKNLLQLYKEEHLAMKNLNEKRFDTAKSLDKMFGSTPLQSAIAHGSPSAPPPRAFFSDSLLNTVGAGKVENNDAGDEVITRESSGGTNPFEDGVMTDTTEEEVKYEPTDVSQSPEEQVHKDVASAPAEVEEEPSVSLQTVDPLVDPPADVEIPDDYPKDEVRESVSDSLAAGSYATGGLNVIVDDKDDAPVIDMVKEHKEESTKSIDPDVVDEPQGNKDVTASVLDYCDAMNYDTPGLDPSGEKEEVPPSESYCESGGSIGETGVEPTGDKNANESRSINMCESKGPMLKEVEEEDGDDEKEKEVDNPAPEISVEAEDGEASVEDSVPTSDEEEVAKGNEVKPEEVATPKPVKPPQPVHVHPEEDYFKSITPTAPHTISKQSYYDVQEASYIETKKYLDQHNNLVKYIEDWERILFQRVHALYSEYMKHRKNLQHYIKKVDSLHKEMAKLQKAAAKAAEENKDKPIPPKKIEKLERNEGKLSGARETHDNSGESLFLFLDEVVNRAWRDAFPLLQRTIKFDQDFSAMQAKMYLRLSGTIELLDLIGRNESASTLSRLQSLKTLHPEVMYSGDEMTTI